MTHRTQGIAWQGTLGLALGLTLWSPPRAAAAEAEKAAQAKTQTQVSVHTAPPAASAPSGEKIVHTFPDDAKMEEFKKLWQQRQGVLVRMSVLQAYWNEEQTLLDQLNHTLSTDDALDVSKSYSLDSARRVLIEQEAPPALPPAASNATGGTPQAQGTPLSSPSQPPPSQKP